MNVPEYLNVSCLHRIDPKKFTQLTFIVTNILLISLVLLVVFGNALVIAAVLRSRKLQSVNAYFITSLSFADLAVGIFVLPLSTALEGLQVWIFGKWMCQIWLTFVEIRK